MKSSTDAAPYLPQLCVSSGLNKSIFTCKCIGSKCISHDSDGQAERDDFSSISLDGV